MNEFEYVLLEKKIDSFTTIKQHDECARMLYNKILDLSNSRYNSHYANVDIKKNGITTYENIYKALRKTINNYKGKSGLPGFILQGLSTVHESLVFYYAANGVTYERFLDVFKYNTEVKLGWIDINSMKIFVEIVMDNPLPFTLNYTYNASNIHSRASSGFNVHSALNECLELEELKRTLQSDIRYTVLEDALDVRYKHVVSSATTKETMPDFVQAMKHLVEVSQTACDRIQRENFNG